MEAERQRISGVILSPEGQPWQAFGAKDLNLRMD